MLKGHESHLDVCQSEIVELEKHIATFTNQVLYIKDVGEKLQQENADAEVELNMRTSDNLKL